MKLFFIVPARDRNHVKKKIGELADLGVPYTIVCGEPLEYPNVVYRKPQGKYDAINSGSELIPEDTEIVVLNDVDTRIHNFRAALSHFRSERTALVFVKNVVIRGPQRQFYVFEDAIRRKLLIAADGELMLIRRVVLDRILPLKPCKAEDTYIMFSVLERGYKTIFCEETYTETERTKNVEKEGEYKRKVVTGIYQALSYTIPPPLIRLFYTALPFLSVLLLIMGRKGYYWMKGILLGYLDYIRGDRSGLWQTTYME